jgi:hypothetical protein
MLRRAGDALAGSCPPRQRRGTCLQYATLPKRGGRCTPFLRCVSTRPHEGMLGHHEALGKRRAAAAEPIQSRDGVRIS